MSGPIFPGYNPMMGTKDQFAPAYVRDRVPLTTDINSGHGYFAVPSLWIHFKENDPTDSDLYALTNIDQNSATWVLLGTASGMSTEIQGDDGTTAVPDGSGIIYLVGEGVANGTNAKPIYFNAQDPNAFSVTLEVQYSGNPASTQASAAGIASFDSSTFSVDANGWVTLLNGLYAASLSPDFGADVVPDGSGIINLSGQMVAATSTPIQTSNGGANTLNIDVQRSAVGTAGNPNECGICYFSSSDFTITSDGFVQLAGAGAGGVADILTDDGAPAVVPSSGTITITGTGGIVTSGVGPGSTVTIDGSGITQLTWNTVTVNTGMTANEGYITNSAGSVDLLLPATASVGDVVKCIRRNTGGMVITQAAGQTVHFGSSSTTTGATGSITSNNQYDCLTLRCIVANTDFVVESSTGASFTVA